MLLAGDIGGTKTNLAVFSREAGLRSPVMERTYTSGDYVNLESMVEEFLAVFDQPVERASFGVAGPVFAGEAQATNLPWTLEENQLRENLGLSEVKLVNDLQAVAQAVPFLALEDLVALQAGEQVETANRAVIAPGTGLGEAFLTWDGSRYRAYASEGGHADFAPRDSLELDLLRYLQTRFDHVSYERVCSGSGIPNIYQFLKESGFAPEPGWLNAQLAMAPDPTPVIVNAALDPAQSCELCTKTLSTFVSILGAEAGNLALKVLAVGGVYLGGGIPPRILSILEDPVLLNSFSAKGRFSELLSGVPLYVINNPKAALWGAACSGLDLIPETV